MPLAMNQLGACLQRIRIEKKRNIRGCLCEYCSHFILLLLLVFGFALSVVERFDAKIYSTLDITIPPVDTNDSLNSFSASMDILHGPLVVPNIDQYLAIGRLLDSTLSGFRSVLQATVLAGSIDNIMTPGPLHFAPAGPQLDSLIDHLNTTYVSFRTLELYIHDSEDEAVKFIQKQGEAASKTKTKKDDDAVVPLALIVLRQIGPEKVNYVIRQKYDTLPNTNSISIAPTIGIDDTYLTYFFSGHLTLKQAVDNWAFNYTGATNNNNFSVDDANIASDNQCAAGSPNSVLIPYPTFAYDQNPFYTSVGFLLGLAMIMSTMYPMSKLAKSIVEEKELKMRELMKIMGLKDYIHRLSWFLASFILFLWIAVSSTFLTTTSFIKASNGMIIFIFYFLFCMTEINLSMLVSVFFSNSKLAAIAAPVVLFATILPRYIFYTVEDEEEVGNKVLACFLSPTAFAFGTDFISEYEYAGVGIQPFNLFEGPFNMGIVITMLIVDFFVYGFLAWYLDQVLPQEFGTPKHPLFIFLPSYWCGKSCQIGHSRGRVDGQVGTSHHHIHLDFEDMEEFEPLRQDADSPRSDKIEQMPREMLEQGKVRIKHLGKTYGDGKVAVKDLSLTMLEGQITCLLGHNGAGKTTTIAALTGLIEATKGDVSIYGHLLSEDLPEIRQLTGLCPQQNVLFPMLTVKEHLVFFGRLKGLYGATLRQQIDTIIGEVGLTEKRHVQSSALSGGMKRKLCLAMALMGEPRFVLLDEPTSGMDPYSRRATWELLQKHKAGRVMMLTTHFMDEADTLADRIAIMADGMLLCSGSSLFLKNRFGAGYLLTCSRMSADTPIEALDEEVKSIIPTASLVSAVAGEIIYGLPLLSAPSFPQLFGTLEAKKETLGIKAFGISITTLEQVFISLAHGHDEPNLALAEMPARQKGSSLCQNAQKIFPCARSDVQEVMQSPGPSTNPEQKVNEGEQNKQLVAIEEGAVGNEGGQLSLQTEVVHHNATYKALGMDEVKDTLVSNEGSGIAKVSIMQQLKELYRKRLIIALRDLKGFFFQIIFPAIQILLILLILNVEINPAGQTLILNGNLFSRYGLIDASAYLVNSWRSTYATNVDGGFTVYHASNSSDNSTALSEWLLNKEEFEDLRYGAFVFRDQIPLDLTVDWEWTKNQLSEVNNGSTGEAINDVLTSIYGDDYSFTFDGSNATAGDGGTVFGVPVNGLNITANQDTVDNILSFFNLTDLVNSTNIVDAIQDFLPDGSVNITTSRETTITVNSTGITLYVSVSLTTDLVDDDAVSQQQNITRTIAWSDVTFADIEPFLPDGRQTYNLTLPSRYSILHNTTSPHAVAAWEGELVEAAFQTCQDNPDAEYYVKNHPLPLSTQESLTIRVILSVLTSIFILVPLCYIPAAFVSFLVRERVTKCKHLQITSGVSPALYWIGTYLWDMSLFVILAGFILIAFYIVGKSSSSVFVGDAESNLAVLCMVLVYGASAIPLNYLYSFAFSNYSTAQISLTLLNFMTGFVLVMAYFVMFNIPETKDAAVVLVHIFRFFPAYNIGEGFINLSTTYFENSILGGNRGPFEWNVCGRCLVFMFAEAIGYGLIVILTESPLVRRLWTMYNVYSVQKYGPPPPPKHAIDEDVLEEEQEVKKYLRAVHDLRGEGVRYPELADSDIGDEAVTAEEEKYKSKAGHLALLIDQLIKIYVPLSLRGGQPKYAVRGMSLACMEGERFGLLGINGAGKTTTLSVLTGESVASSGEIFIGNEPLSNSLTQRMLGYCPQVDPLLELMTAYETLYFFGRIRGLSESVLQQRVNSLVRQTGLLPHAHRPCGTYSGGNKRKLSLAVALIGDPKVLLLDEPSTGMDPEARRHMWSVIEQVSAQRTVILVSHSMEEIEALCTRVGVMVSGRMQCLGSAQHLKSKFGGAYTVELRCAQEHVDEALQLLQAELGGLVVEERHGGFLRLRLEKDSVQPAQLGRVFSLLEEHKQRLRIYDYSVSQCSLEQVFIKFAKEQEEEPAHSDGRPPASTPGVLAVEVQAPRDDANDKSVAMVETL